MGLPAIPYALPVIGHLHLLGNDHASAYAQLAVRHGAPVFQICLGNKRAIVFNDFTSARRILQANASATIDRPQLYTFHGVVSSTQGFSIGSSPWDESCRRKRKLASATLSRAGIGNFLDMIDRESKRFLMAVKVQQCENDATVSLKWPAQRYALSSSMKICYGIEMEDADDALLAEVLEVGEAISLLRSASANRQDYVPFLRYLPNEKTRQSQVFRERRDIYLAGLMERGREAIRRGHAKPCISSAVLRDEEAALTAQEIGSICLSMISGGFEAIPSTLTMCCAALITPAGKSFQEAAYVDIRRHYPTNEAAWQASLVEEEVPYVNALIKETLRHYTVTAMIPPRQTTVDIRWENGAVIPAGTMILVNAQAANHGKQNVEVEGCIPPGRDGGERKTMLTVNPSSGRMEQMSPTSALPPRTSIRRAGWISPVRCRWKRKHRRARCRYCNISALELGPAAAWVPRSRIVCCTQRLYGCSCATSLRHYHPRFPRRIPWSTMLQKRLWWRMQRTSG